MGGTFDPIHIGHLVTADAVRQEFALEKVLFVPACDPPHKQNLPVTPASHRYNMTVMATYSNPFFFVSDIELKRPGLSYSVDTIRALLDEYGTETDIYFITGIDAVRELPTWHHIHEMLDICHFVAATRPGTVDTLDSVIAFFGEKGRERIHRLATPELEISSTDIRDRVRKGLTIKYIVPESVENYIVKEQLYC